MLIRTCKVRCSSEKSNLKFAKQGPCTPKHLLTLFLLQMGWGNNNFSYLHFQSDTELPHTLYTICRKIIIILIFEWNVHTINRISIFPGDDQDISCSHHLTLIYHLCLYPPKIKQHSFLKKKQIATSKLYHLWSPQDQARVKLRHMEWSQTWNEI